MLSYLVERSKCRTGTRIALFVAAVFGGISCTNVNLESQPMIVTLNGQFCTNTSDTYDAPVRVMLIVDTSKSMEDTDPSAQRADAALELIQTLNKSVEDVEFSILYFNTDSQPLTSGFLDYDEDAAALNAAVEMLRIADGYTNYFDAVNTAIDEIHADIRQTQDELAELAEQNPEIRIEEKRPAYFIIFLTDGRPFVPGRPQDEDAILDSVERLTKIAQNYSGSVRAVQLHTAFLSSPATTDQERDLQAQGRNITSQMADVGGGLYRDFASGDEIDFKQWHFEVINKYDFHWFMVSNMSARTTYDGNMTYVLADSDRDGCTDVLEETEIGTSSTNPDTDGDLLLDCQEYESASEWDPLKPDSGCAREKSGDEDQDGLTDCQDNAANLSTERFDTDQDYITDDIELLFGISGTSNDDLSIDFDADGRTNAIELWHHTSPKNEDTLQYAYDYSSIQCSRRNVTDGSMCCPFSVSNIAVVPTHATDDTAKNENVIVLYYIESPVSNMEGRFHLMKHVLHVDYSAKQNVFEVFPSDFVQASTQDGLDE